MKNRLISASLVLVCLIISASTRADTDQAIIAALQAQVQALIARVEALEGRLDGHMESRLESHAQIVESSLTAPIAPIATELKSAGSSTTGVKIKADFRYRHETIDTSNS